MAADLIKLAEYALIGVGALVIGVWAWRGLAWFARQWKRNRQRILEDRKSEMEEVAHRIQSKATEPMGALQFKMLGAEIAEQLADALKVSTPVPHPAEEERAKQRDAALESIVKYLKEIAEYGSQSLAQGRRLAKAFGANAYDAVDDERAREMEQVEEYMERGGLTREQAEQHVRSARVYTRENSGWGR